MVQVAGYGQKALIMRHPYFPIVIIQVNLIGTQYMKTMQLMRTLIPSKMAKQLVDFQKMYKQNSWPVTFKLG